MDVVTIILAMLSLLGAVAFKLVTTEMQDWIPIAARCLVERAVVRLPEQDRDRYREEWLADLDNYPGRIAKLWRSIGFMIAARGLLKVSNSQSMQSRSGVLDDFQLILDEYKALEANDKLHDHSAIALDLNAEELGLIARVASRYHCSTEIAAAALIAFSIRHKEYFRFDGME